MAGLPPATLGVGPGLLSRSLGEFELGPGFALALEIHSGVLPPSHALRGFGPRPGLAARADAESDCPPEMPVDMLLEISL